MTARRQTVFTLIILLAGCGGGVDDSYGRSRTQSVNGTTVLADLFRARGHEVRSAVRLTGELKNWADVIVRFAQTGGGPPLAESQWYSEWFSGFPKRSLVYVPRDYDATLEYWTRAFDQLPPSGSERTRKRIEQFRSQAVGWEKRLPEPAKTHQWFTVGAAKRRPVCQRVAGPWAVGLDVGKAALTIHRPLKLEKKRLLLSGDGMPMVIDWSPPGGGRVLVASSGVFLLNVPLTEPARWPLAVRTAYWAEAHDETEAKDGSAVVSRPLRVAFVEGPRVTADAAGPPSVFALLKVQPFGLVTAQLFALGLAACLARAPRLGRPRADEPTGADRPVAHPEALGALLARTRQANEARSILETYRRWRTGPGRAALAAADRDAGTTA